MLPTARGLRGFTLIELIVVILILGILAAVAVVGYTQITTRAHEARAAADLRQLSTLVAVELTQNGAELTRETLRTAMVDAGLSVKAQDGLSAAGWEIGLKGEAPTRAGQVSVGFDGADGVNDSDGERAALIVGSDSDHEFAVIITEQATFSTVIKAEEGVTPARLLGATEGTSVPPLSNGVFPLEPVTSTPDPTPTTPPVVVTPPAVPAGVSVSADGFEYTVTWDSVEKATSYLVATRLGDGEWVETPRATASLTGELPAGATVTVRVKAIGPGGPSDWSAERSVKSTEPTEPPAAPELSAETANGSVANLTWTAPEGARSYTVLRTMTTNAGAQFNSPMDVAVAADGTIYVADSSNHRIRKIAPDGTVTTLAGSSAGYVDGTGAAAKFVQPRGLAIGPDGNVYVADTGNHRIRKVTPDGVVTTVAGTGVNSFADGAAKTAAKFSNPWDVVVAGDGTIYVADYGNYRVRKITTAGAVSTLAGTATKGSPFGGPQGIAIAADGNLLVTNEYTYTINKVTMAGVVTNFATSGTAPGTLAVDSSGVVYVAAGVAIRRFSATGAMLDTIGVGQGYTDGAWASAQFGTPKGVSVAPDGTVVVADMLQHRIRRLDPVARTVSTVAGTGVFGAAESVASTSSASSVYQGAATSFRDTGLAAGVRYEYTVVAHNALGSSPASVAVAVRP